MFHTIFYVPLYNALLFLTDLFGGSLGFAVIGLTIIVKLILAPLAHASIKSQIEQKKLQPLVEELKKKYPDTKEQNAKLMELYKEHKTNPFAGCLLLLLQLPVIIALYRVFMSGTAIVPADVYGFITAPTVLYTSFLGIDLAGAHIIILAILAGVSQFLQMHWSPSMQSSQPTDTAAPTDMAASMQKSMKYTMPVMITFFAFAVPGAVALYWIVSNIIMIIQERIVMKTAH